MIRDMCTVLWKEWRSLLRQPGGRLRLAMVVAIPAGHLGIVAPLIIGTDYAIEANPWFIAVVLPIVTVTMTAPDSFAGERERKTLRTLLASRLPDHAILWAKVAFATGLGMATMLTTQGIAMVTVNATTSAGALILVPADRLAFIVAVSLLVTAAMAGAAVLISLRAATVQQAQQTLGAGFFLIPTVLGALLLVTSRNGASTSLRELFGSLGTMAGRLSLMGGLLVLAVTLLLLARTGFKRSRLVS